MIKMSQKINDSKILEPQIKSLIELANTEFWKSGLNILYLNSSVLKLSEEFDIPCLVSASSSYEDVESSIDLFLGKAKTEILSFIKPLFKVFFPPLIGIMSEIKIETDIEGNITESTTLAILAKFTSNYIDLKNKISKILLDGMFSLSEFFIIAIFESLNQVREGQIHSGILEDDYEEMIEALKKVEFIKPKLQVSLCPSCLNYELSLTNYPSIDEYCPKCGDSWATQSLYVFDKSYSLIKSQNLDLPLFITSFLRQQVGFQAPLSEPEIQPNARVSIASGEGQVEIDVFIPQFKIGIECKIFEDALAPMTITRVNGISGRLSNQINSYIDAGIESIIVITNLTKDSAQKIQQKLQKIYNNRKNNKLKITVFGGNIEDLLNFLTIISNGISAELNKAFEYMLQKSLPEQDKIDE